MNINNAELNILRRKINKHIKTPIENYWIIKLDKLLRIGLRDPNAWSTKIWNNIKIRYWNNNWQWSTKIKKSIINNLA